MCDNMVDKINVEIREIASRIKENGARDALRPFLRVFLPGAFSVIQNDYNEVDLSIILNASNLSLGLLVHRMKYGIPRNEVDDWNTIGHAVIEVLFPNISSIPIKTISDIAYNKVSSLTDGTQIMLQIDLGIAGNARAFISQNGKVASCYSTGHVRIHEIVGGKIVLNSRQSIRPMSDVLLYKHDELWAIDQGGQVLFGDIADCSNVDIRLIQILQNSPNRLSIINNGRDIVTAGTFGVQGVSIETGIRTTYRAFNSNASAINRSFSPKSVLIGTKDDVIHFDTRTDKSKIKLLGSLSPITDISTFEDNIICGSSRNGSFIWDVRWPHQPIYCLEVPGYWPIGPPSCTASLVRSHTIEICRGDAIFHYSMYDGRLLSTTRFATQRPIGIGMFHTTIMSNSRVNTGPSLIVASFRVPFKSDANEWSIL